MRAACRCGIKTLGIKLSESVLYQRQVAIKTEHFANTRQDLGWAVIINWCPAAHVFHHAQQQKLRVLAGD
jgi:hypothetical protein